MIFSRAQDKIIKIRIEIDGATPFDITDVGLISIVGEDGKVLIDNLRYINFEASTSSRHNDTHIEMNLLQVKEYKGC